MLAAKWYKFSKSLYILGACIERFSESSYGFEVNYVISGLSRYFRRLWVKTMELGMLAVVLCNLPFVVVTLFSWFVGFLPRAHYIVGNMVKSEVRFDNKELSTVKHKAFMQSCQSLSNFRLLRLNSQCCSVLQFNLILNVFNVPQCQ